MDSPFSRTFHDLLAKDETEDNSRVSPKLSAKPSRKRFVNPVGHDPRGFIHLNLLAMPSQDRPKCELCENMGRLMCANCKVSFYCVVDHFLLDKGFHSGICSTVAKLRQPIEFSPSQETRDRLNKQRRLHLEELFNYALKRGQSSLEKGLYDDAIPSATVASNYAKILYGQAEEVIPPMLIAAEAHLKRGNIPLAEGFLARSQNIELGQPNLRPSIKSKIRHNEGIIAMAKDETNEALMSFADQVYQASEEYGPEHRKTALGYCNMGRLFHVLNNYSSSISLFRQVVGIWTKYVMPILEEMTAESVVPKISGMKYKDIVWIDDTDQYDASDCLIHCFKHQLQCMQIPDQTHVNSLDLANTCHTLSALYYICKRTQEAHGWALEGLQHLEAHHTQDPIFVKKFQRLIKLSGSNTNVQKDSQRGTI